jgi:hypothetical protein
VRVDSDKQFVCNISMIQSFASSETESFFATWKSRRLPQDILKRAERRHASTGVGPRQPIEIIEKLAGNEAGMTLSTALLGPKMRGSGVAILLLKQFFWVCYQFTTCPDK